VRPLLSAQVLPACDLQAVLPECSQLPENVRETHELLQPLHGGQLCSLVRSSGGCGLRSGLCRTGSGHVRGSVCAQVRSGSRSHVRCSLCSGLCTGSGHVCGSVCAQVRSGSHVRCSLCSGLCTGPGHVRSSVCAQVRSGSRKLRRSLCSGSGEVLRHRLRQEVLCRSLRSRPLDL
jgi:hypothetical protein